MSLDEGKQEKRKNKKLEIAMKKECKSPSNKTSEVLDEEDKELCYKNLSLRN